jgi:hypothetical protein
LANANLTVTINASGAQTGAQAYVTSVTAMGTATSTLSNQVAGISGQLNSLIGILQQTSNANRNTAGSFVAFTAAGIAESAIRSFLGALGELIVESTLYAARTQELGVALDAIALASNESVKSIKQQEFAMKQLNITTQDARQTLARFIQADLDIGKSGALARTAQDLAVIAGFSTSEEINKLVIGIQTLQSRNLRTAGVFITVDEVLDRLAKTTHRARDSFSTFEKQQAVLNAVLEFGTRVTGAYEASMETASKQIRSMERLVREAQNAFGALFIPVLEVVVKLMSDMFIWMEIHPKLFAALIASVTLLSASFLVLNTRLLQVTLQAGAFVIQGVIRMIALLPIFNINLARTAAALHLTGAAAQSATASMTGLQIAIGGILGLVGIVGLILGLATAFVTLDESLNGFVKVTDTAIIQGTAYVKSLEERKQAVLEFRQSLKEIESGQLSTGVSLVKQFKDQAVITEEVRARFENTKNQVKSLRTEIAGLSESLSNYQSAGLSGNNLDQRNALSSRLQVAQQALDVQVEALRGVGESYKAAKIYQDAVGESLVKEALARGVSVETLTKHASVAQKYLDIMATLNPLEKAQVAARQDEARAIDDLIQRENKLAGTRLSSLLANIKVAEESRDAANQAIDQQQKQLNLLKQEEVQLRGLTPSASIVLPQESGRDRITTAAQRIKEVESATQELNKTLAEQGTAFIESDAKVAEFNRQVVLLYTGYGLSTDALIKLLYETDKSGVSYDQLSKKVNQVIDDHKRYTKSLEEAATGIFDLEQAIASIKIPEFNIAGPEENTGKLFRTLRKQSDDYLKYLQGTGRVAEAFTNLPEEYTQKFIERAPAFKRLADLVKDRFGGSVQEALQTVFADPLLLKELGIPQEDQAKFFAFFEKTYAAYLEMEKRARNANKLQETEFDRLTKSLERANAKIDSFLKPGSKEFKLRYELENAERTVKDLETITTLRHKLGIPLTMPIDLQNVQKSRQELEVLVKVFDEIREANNEIYTAKLRAGAPLVTAEVRAQTTLLKLIRERRQEENQLQADIATAILRRTQLERDAREVDRIQAKVFLETLENEQKVLQEGVAAAARLSVTLGDFSFAEDNRVIQNALKTANDPVVEELNNTQKVIENSAREIQKTQVDWSKALGDSVTRGGDAVRVTVDHKVSETNTILRHHTDLLQSIRDKETTQYNASGVTFTEGGSSPSFASLEELFKKHFPQVDTNRLGREGSRIDPNQVHYGKTGSYRVGDLIIADLSDAIRKGLDPLKIYRQTVQESHYNPFAESGTGAVGLKQITGRTGKALGVPGDLRFDPYKAIEAGNRLMVENLDIAKRLSPQADDLQKYAIALSLYVDGIQAYNQANGDLSKMRQTPGYLRAVGVNLPKTPQGPQTAFDYTQQSVPKKLIWSNLAREMMKNLTNKFLERGEEVNVTTEQLQYRALFQGAVTGLGLPDTGANKLFFNDKAGRTALKNLQSDRDSLLQELDLREKILNVRTQTSAQRDKDHLRGLIITKAEEDFTRAQRVRVDNEFELIEARRELNRLYTDAIAITEELQKASLNRLNKEAEAQRETIRLQEEQNFRNDPANRQRHLNNLRQDEYNRRWQDEQTLNDRISMLEDERDEGYVNSALFRARVERESYASRLELHRDLNRQIIQLDDDLAHHGETHALEYSIAWREALIDVKNRHANAIKSILSSQASIQDQMTYDPVRVRAAVLEDINRIEGVSESIGGLFNDTFKVYTDQIDAWVDKTTEKMGNLGKIFNSFFKSIFHRSIGSVQNTILDAIFPPSAEELNARNPLASGGSSKTEESFRSLASSTVALGQVQAGAIDVTFQSATALGQLTRSAVVASEALLQVGAVVAGLSSVGGGGALTGSGVLAPLVTSGGAGGGTLSSISRAVANIGLGGLGTNPRSAQSGILGSILNRGTFPTGGFAGGFPGGTSPASIVQSILSRQTLSTGPLASLPLLSQSGKGGTLSQILGKGGPLSGVGSIFTKGGLGNLAKGIAGGIGPQLPFLGLGLGASLGGSSKFGGILGGLGGAILGLGGLAGLGASAGFLGLSGLGLGAAGAGGLATSIFGSLGLGGLSTSIGTAAAGSALAPIAGLLSFLGPAALIAAPLLIGATILGRNKQRREEEKVRDQLGGDLRTTLYRILADIKADRMEGSAGITQANDAVEAYRQQVMQLKDRKTRDHAIGFIKDVQPIIQQIEQAARLQVRRQEFESKLIPTYALGGTASTNWIRVSQGERMEFPSGKSYNIPGPFDARDNIMAFVPTGTKIKSPHPNAVHRYATGGTAGIAPAASSLSTSSVIHVTVINVLSDRDAIELSKKIPNSVIGDKAAADSRVRPNTLPASIGKELQKSY